MSEKLTAVPTSLLNEVQEAIFDHLTSPGARSRQRIAAARGDLIAYRIRFGVAAPVPTNEEQP